MIYEELIFKSNFFLNIHIYIYIYIYIRAYIYIYVFSILFYIYIARTCKNRKLMFYNCCKYINL